MDRTSSGRALPLNATSTLDERLALLATLGATPAGIDRRLFSQPDYEARSLFAQWARAAGFAVSQDRAGNVFARREGRSGGAPIVTGSHLDTVPTGGAYDGAYGAVAALCVLEAFEDERIATERPLEAVAWAGEEGSRFPLGCLGSAAFAGLNAMDAIDALVDENGMTFAQARVSATGLLPGVPVRESTIVPAAYVELHIEQGPVLERSAARIGNVTAIAGQARFSIEVEGSSGHAGTVPMAMRHDALSAAAQLVLALEDAARSFETAVLTVGRFVVEPNQTNVIPARVIFRVDARSVDEATLAALRDAVHAHGTRIARERGVTIAVHPIEDRRAVIMDGGLRQVLADAFTALDVAVIDLPSGAGHDAMCVAAIAPVAMIFVPSAGGRSHVDEEYTSPEDLELGVRALVRALAAIDLHRREK